MKKYFMIGAIAIACTFTQTAKAQSFLQKLLEAAATTAATQQQAGTTGTTTQQTQQDVLGSILNNVVGNATNAANSKTGTNAGSILGNIISSVTGSATTTQANLIGAWAYASPAVQFESKNLLTQAGGATIATKCETKLAQYYKVVGIKPGNMSFSFAQDGTCTYGVGKKMLNGTYVFDQKAKTVTITTATGQNVKAFVTISGANMSLCFDGTKLLTLFTNISSKFSSLSTVGALASNYDGMKVGFKFTK